MLRSGRRTSPLTPSAPSMPWKAKVASSTARPNACRSGAAAARLWPWTCRAPRPSSSARGRSFTTVSTTVARDPAAAPRMFTAASAPNSTSSAAARSAGLARAGTNSRRASITAAPIPAAARTEPTQTMTPVTNPAPGPSAAVTKP